MTAQNDDRPELFGQAELYKPEKPIIFLASDPPRYRSLHGVASVLLADITHGQASFYVRRDPKTGELLAKPLMLTIGRSEWTKIAPGVEGQLEQCYNKEHCRLVITIAVPSA